MSTDVLPDSRLRVPKGVVLMDTPFGKVNHVPIFCANCGVQSPYMCPAENMTFLFWLCDDKCAPKWKALAGTYTVPDRVFWERVKQEQIDKYGRELSAEELVEVLKDENSSLSKLCKDRAQIK